MKSMATSFDPVQYKINTKANWENVASEYHYNWAAKQIGPFKSTSELVHISEIKRTDKVLDLGCGTGVVSYEVSKYLGDDGLVVGVDLSRSALMIAKKSLQKNSLFVEMDLEYLGLHFKFDKILSQYALMFCPDAKRVLESAGENLKTGGKVVIAVHGLSDEVPYFSSIMKPVLEVIPEIRPQGTPTVHRFGNPADLKQILVESGYVSVSIQKFTYTYKPGTFEEYWDDYMHSTANSIWPRIEKSGKENMLKIKETSKKNVADYTENGNITFPWTVLIASAVNDR